MKTKKQRKQKKQEILYNKRMVKKYPWLHPMSWAKNSLIERRDPKYDYSYLRIFNDISGWWRAFGKMFCDEIQEQYKNCPNLYVQYYKEKYGRLDMYFGGANQEIIDIADKYSILAENICIVCGKPDVPQFNVGWIIPICEKCYKTHINCTLPYEKAVTDCHKMADEIVWRNSDGEHKINIKETANKIRKKWRE